MDLLLTTGRIHVSQLDMYPTIRLRTYIFVILHISRKTWIFISTTGIHWVFKRSGALSQRNMYRQYSFWGNSIAKFYDGNIIHGFFGLHAVWRFYITMEYVLAIEKTLYLINGKIIRIATKSCMKNIHVNNKRIIAIAVDLNSVNWI